MLKVAKFGGSSVSDAGQFAKVRAIIRSDPSRKVVVSSAAGKRSPDDHKMTDLLYLCHAHLTYGVPCDDILDSIQKRFEDLRDELGLTYDVVADFAALRGRMNKSMSVDELASRGEYFTSKLLAEYLGFTFVDAADCIFFTFDGKLDKDKTYEAISKALSEHNQILIPGFYGVLPNGKIKVMSRGGSDITGAIAAAAIGADLYENWTDVSGMLMADPKIVEKPLPITTVTYAELKELAFMGASILHEESIQPVKEKGISINIRNTNAPDDPGTLIVDKIEENKKEDRFITGLAGKKNFTILTVQKHNMNTCEILKQALEIIDRYHTPLEHIMLGLESFAMVVSTTEAGDSIYDIIGDLKKTCQPDNLQIQDNVALVAAIGRMMAYQPGISGKIFKALGDNKINIKTIVQGADELAIIIGVDNNDFENAIRVLYRGFAG